MSGVQLKFVFDLLAIPCYFAARGTNAECTMRGVISGVDYTVHLRSNNSPAVGIPNEAERRVFLNELEINLHDEHVDVLAHEMPEFHARELLFMKFVPIVIEIINRLVGYFKYVKRNPLPATVSFVDFRSQESALFNPLWKTGAGEDLALFKHPLVSPFVNMPGVGYLMDDSFGIEYFDEGDCCDLQQQISEGRQKTLVEEILSDAQSAALHSNFRRAVLELAIAIEVFVKNNFFKRERVAGAAYEYLEDKGRESVKVVELLDGASIYAFGESFKKSNPGAYRDIDHIFRCRNKIAHRGEFKFRDDAGDWLEVDRKRLKSWWRSTLVMFDWLRRKNQ